MSPLPTHRTVECWLPQYECRKLRQGEFRWCVARQFYSRKGVLSSTLWRSLAVAPRNRVSWESTYAFNWTLLDDSTDEVDKAVSSVDEVQINGVWQRCELGEAYELDECGYWTPSAALQQESDKDHMTVSVNHYRPDDRQGVHIVIGQRSPRQVEWEPIYVDATELGVNMKAWYRPSEQAEWWFESGPPSQGQLSKLATSRGISTPKESFDMTSANEVGYCSTTYDFDKGEWITSLRPPPQSLTRADALHSSGLSSNGSALALRTRSDIHSSGGAGGARTGKPPTVIRSL